MKLNFVRKIEENWNKAIHMYYMTLFLYLHLFSPFLSLKVKYISYFLSKKSCKYKIGTNFLLFGSLEEQLYNITTYSKKVTSALQVASVLICNRINYVRILELSSKKPQFIIWLSSLFGLCTKWRMTDRLPNCEICFFAQTGKLWRENFQVDLKTNSGNKPDAGTFYKRFTITNYQKSS